MLESFSNFWILFGFFSLSREICKNMGLRNEQQQQRVWRPMGLLLFLSFLLLLFVSVQGFEVKPAGMENLLDFFSFAVFLSSLLFSFHFHFYFCGFDLLSVLLGFRGGFLGDLLLRFFLWVCFL